MTLSQEEQLQKLRTSYVPQGPVNLTLFFAKKASRAIIYDVEGR